MIGDSSIKYEYIDDIHTTEKQKNSIEYLKGNIDYWISNLVKERTYLSTYRNYYNGIRDEKEFEYLQSNYGIGSPINLSFTNIIKPRIDALLAQIVSDDYDYSVAMTDDDTIDFVIEQKRFKKLNEIEDAINSYVNSVKNSSSEIVADLLAEDINNIHSKYGSSYLSDFQIAAASVLKYFINSPVHDTIEKIKQLALDILITGEAHYRVYVDKIGADPIFEVIKPENMFYNKNTNSQYLDLVDAVVHREFMTRKQILAKYGMFMKKEDINNMFGTKILSDGGISIRSGETIEEDARVNNGRSTISSQMSSTMMDVIPVYHVEFLASNKVPIEDPDDYDMIEKSDSIKFGFRVDRYEGTRIGNYMYVNAGKSKYIERSQSRPYEASLTYNSIFNSDRNGIPYSIVGALKEPQDLYDIIMFYRDNLVANSGVPGDRINIAAIPKVLGNNFMDRLMKFISYKKVGYELIDPTERGAQYFNHYGSFDNSLKGNTVISINNILTMIEKQANTIAGTTDQMLGIIAERDAVGNVRQGIKQSLMINMPLFNLVRSAVRRISMAYLNSAKIAYKRGRKLSYISGGKSYVFDVIPDNFIFTDYNVYVSFSKKDSEKIDIIRQLAPNLIDPKTGGISADVLLSAALTDSPEEARTIIEHGISKQKKEAGQLEQAYQQVQQLQQQLKEMQKEFTAMQSKLNSNEEAQLNIERKKLDLKSKELDYKYLDNKDKRDIEKDKIRVDEDSKEQIAALERSQLFLGNGPERKPNQNKLG